MAILATRIFALLFAISSVQIHAAPLYPRQTSNNTECVQASTQTLQSISAAAQAVDKLVSGGTPADPKVASALTAAQTGIKGATEGLKSLVTSLMQKQTPSTEAQNEISKGFSAAQAALQSVQTDDKTIKPGVEDALNQLNNVATDGRKAISACGFDDTQTNQTSTPTSTPGDNSTTTEGGPTGSDSGSSTDGQTGQTGSTGTASDGQTGQTGQNSTTTGTDPTGQTGSTTDSGSKPGQNGTTDGQQNGQTGSETGTGSGTSSGAGGLGGLGNLLGQLLGGLVSGNGGIGGLSDILNATLGGLLGGVLGGGSGGLGGILGGILP
ncbi:hypothetical protein E1B28_007767 [Marasmius oreades]|uniref:Uncharacterized protein n=1 Tax=Marasmius oreades TaxID=181124 RepID=A0A9P7S2L8_9AGAR|nr:uncharacterized protein E1B28_007767 [Marasmius oreades]KAG7094155.1 hypothetical protein E1B28_007767 [Marasmius oreades]